MCGAKPQPWDNTSERPGGEKKSVRHCCQTSALGMAQQDMWVMKWHCA